MATLPKLIFVGVNRDDTEAKRDEYFRLRPDELERFDQNPDLVIELRWGERTP